MSRAQPSRRRAFRVGLCALGPESAWGGLVLPAGIPDSGLAAGVTARRLALSARGAGSPAGGAGDTISQLLVSPR